MDEKQALALFAGGDEDQARNAFEFLAPVARRCLESFLRPCLKDSNLREDFLQEALYRVYRGRHTFQDKGLEAWHGFLRRTAKNVCLDHCDRAAYKREVSPGEWESGETADPSPSLLGTIIDALQTETARRQADHIWLGLDPAVPAEVHTRRLLAAQYFYLDSVPWNTVLQLLPPPRPGEPPLTRARLDTWLADPAVLRHLAYSTLYFDGDRLAAHLLGFEELGDLYAAVYASENADPAAHGPGGWTWGETRVILWRFRSALPLDRIRERLDCPLSDKELMELSERTRACFPFKDQMLALMTALGASGREALTDKKLWQRLAFQYFYGGDLPHKDIQDRIQPAYRLIVGGNDAGITLSMLNAWLSGHRLLDRLAQACRGEEGGDDDE